MGLEPSQSSGSPKSQGQRNRGHFFQYLPSPACPQGSRRPRPQALWSELASTHPCAPHPGPVPQGHPPGHVLGRVVPWRAAHSPGRILRATGASWSLAGELRPDPRPSLGLIQPQNYQERGGSGGSAAVPLGRGRCLGPHPSPDQPWGSETFFHGRGLGDRSWLGCQSGRWVGEGDPGRRRPPIWSKVGAEATGRSGAGREAGARVPTFKVPTGPQRSHIRALPVYHGHHGGLVPSCPPRALGLCPAKLPLALARRGRRRRVGSWCGSTPTTVGLHT